MSGEIHMAIMYFLKYLRQRDDVMETKFESDMNEAGAIIEWIGNNMPKLNYQEMMIVIAAQQEFAEKLKPIYKKHNSMQFKYKPERKK